MMRSKTSSSLQKTYDECYLICSTAVYFEGQGNEAEALRSWRAALDQIYYHNAYKVPQGYVPKTETERALKDSLRDMEMQCKERVDLLEALKLSRQEQTATDAGEGSSTKLQKSTTRTPRQSSEGERADKGYIGNGTIPAVNYPDLSRPPVLPPRPPFISRSSSDQAVRSSSYLTPQSSSSKMTNLSTPSLVPPMKKSSRSPSPEKGRTMLTTLRDKKLKRPSSRSHKSESKNVEAPPVPSKAASLAWQAITGRSSLEKPGRSSDPDGDHNAADSGRRSSGSFQHKSPRNPSHPVRYDSKTRTLVNASPKATTPIDGPSGSASHLPATSSSNSYPFPPTDPGQPGAVAGAMLTPTTTQDSTDLESKPPSSPGGNLPRSRKALSPAPLYSSTPNPGVSSYPTYINEYPETSARKLASVNVRRSSGPISPAAETSSSLGKLSKRHAHAANSSSPRRYGGRRVSNNAIRTERQDEKYLKDDDTSSQSLDENIYSSTKPRGKYKEKQNEPPILAEPTTPTSDESNFGEEKQTKSVWKQKIEYILKHLPRGVDDAAARQIFNEIVVQGDEVHWEDVAGLEIAKTALKETVVYPFLRPDLFMGLREPARGMLLFGPPGTGKTMLARAVATESKSTFFSISASSLTSKYLGESEKLVRALFALAKTLAPSIIFVDEIDSLLSARSGSGEHEATRRIKTEFLIQWSDLQRAAAGREQSEKDKEKGDASRVLVLAATNLPWAIDEAARRRFVRRQYIPLPEDETRAVQLRTLLSHQKHSLDEEDIQRLVKLTDGFSGSDITALAKDAAMGPLRALGEALLHMSMDDIRPIEFKDFEASLVNIRPSVSKQGLKEYDDWAKEFGERGG
ncbi:AAA family ATPase-like protein [Xylogone sp. PMI_703]|nr:AAA family ATPase-like protein [Xylogone sp. PMI_703]